MEIQNNVKLSEYTTIRLGGPADYFINCNDTESVKGILEYVKDNKMNFIVFSGGSNIIFPDRGFDGLVLRINNKGVKSYDDEKYFYAEVNAGENWDEFVKYVTGAGYSGIECLSGIPGSAGATPVQNVGAYGQEVKDTILNVTAIDRKTSGEITFTNEECRFGYRTSRFKDMDKDKYIILKVLFRFEKNKQPEIKYSELQNLIDSRSNYSSLRSVKEKIRCIRENVMILRDNKSMLINPDDMNSRSCGSFYTNPVLKETEYSRFKELTDNLNQVPIYKSGSMYKLSAAWLVEQSGFLKGFKKGGVGISSKHSLALINISGTTRELLAFSSEIEETVKKKFGIKLKKEPVVVSGNN
ncbi:MAG TPA: UDP-N-acetylmuramate dehydrogenase [Ignavibacteria bacterium]|nr:UDP-N-acetylmuramate dehydrogenase [Ignavibacteria bacterium]HMR40756.1 UDP-N-acetylmuramate dehydrogenase [Ignavibacteria bacterium]